MLITKGVTAGEIITLKLVSGEELVARLKEETDTHYVLSNTRVIGMGQNGPGFMPYLFTVDPESDIPLLKSTVTVIIATESSLASQFITSTTGIKLA